MKTDSNIISRLLICRPFTDLYKTILKGPEFTLIHKNTMLDYTLIGKTLVRPLRRYGNLEDGTLS